MFALAFPKFDNISNIWHIWRFSSHRFNLLFCLLVSICEIVYVQSFLFISIYIYICPWMFICCPFCQRWKESNCVFKYICLFYYMHSFFRFNQHQPIPETSQRCKTFSSSKLPIAFQTSTEKTVKFPCWSLKKRHMALSWQHQTIWSSNKCRNSRFEMVPLKNPWCELSLFFFLLPRGGLGRVEKIPSRWVVEFLKLQCHTNLVPRNRCYPTATAKWLDLIVRNWWLEHAPCNFLDMHI